MHPSNFPPEFTARISTYEVRLITLISIISCVIGYFTLGPNILMSLIGAVCGVGSGALVCALGRFLNNATPEPVCWKKSDYIKEQEERYEE